MKDLFISKGGVDYGDDGAAGVIGGSWEVTSLEEGAIAFFDSTGVFLNGDPTIATDGIYCAVNTANGIKSSVLIDKTTLTYTKQAYAAPVASVKCLGSNELGANVNGYSLNLPASIAVGDTYGVSVIDKTKTPNDTSRMTTYSLSVVSGDVLTGLAAANVITKLVAAINADTNSIVTAVALDDAANNNDGIKFTCDTAGDDFTIAVADGFLSDADVVEYFIVNRAYDALTQANTGLTVLNAIGSGTSTQVAALEKELSTRDGNINSPYLTDYMWSAADSTVSGATYTVYALEFYKPQDNILIRENNPKQVIYIAIPSGETADGKAIYEIDLILADAIS